MNHPCPHETCSPCFGRVNPSSAEETSLRNPVITTTPSPSDAYPPKPSTLESIEMGMGMITIVFPTKKEGQKWYEQPNKKENFLLCM
jgi:hypothetical protein